MSKSQRTQERYRKASRGQGTLPVSSFGFKAPSYPQRVMHKETVLKAVEPDLTLVAQPQLTGEAAAWVVRKQKSHRSASETAMKALEARAKAK
jgi:hypothetical protein